LVNYLICLVGLPASGKSTFAQKFKELIEQKSDDFNVRIIDPDIIRESIVHGDFNHKKEKIVRKKNLKSIKKALSTGNIVISDDLNYYSSMRHELMKIAEKAKVRFFIIHVATPLEICLKWNEERGKKIPNEVIQDISNKFDDFNRYGWDKPIEKFDLSKISNIPQKIEDIINTINIDENRINIDARNGSGSNKPSNLNNERLEKITRNFVGNLLKNPEYRKKKEKILEIRRQFVLENLNKSVSKSEISRAFKKYIENRLDIVIS